MVVLHQDRVIEPEPVVAATTGADGVLCEDAHAWNGLARVAHDQPGPGDPFHVPPGERRDSAQVLHQVEDEPLAGQQRARVALDRCQDVARVRDLSLGGEQPAFDGTELAEDAIEQRQSAHDELLLRQHAPRGARRLGHGRFRRAIATPQVLRQREGDQCGDLRVLERLVRGQPSCAATNVMSTTSTPPSASAARGSSSWASTRAEARTSPRTGCSRSTITGFAARVTLATPLPTDTPPSDFALLIAVRQATAASKHPGSAGAGTPAKSSGPGHDARWMLGCPVSSAKAHDHTSSVMKGSTGAKSRTRTESPSRSAAMAEPPPSERARTFTSSRKVSVKSCQKKASVSCRPCAYSNSSNDAVTRPASARSRCTKARSSSASMGVVSPSCPRTNLPALNSFVTRRFPTFSTFSSKAVSVPSRAPAAQYRMASAPYCSIRCIGVTTLPRLFAIFLRSGSRIQPEIAMCFQGIAFSCSRDFAMV